MSGKGFQRTLTDSLMEMPFRKSGDVDWSTLGNILMAHNLGEVLCASYVDQKYGKKNPGFHADTDWKLAYTEHEVVVLKKEIPGSPVHCFMGRTVIDLPVHEISKFIEKPETAFHWNKFIVDARILETFVETDTVRQTMCYTRHEATQCLVKAKRDFVFYHHISNMNGRCVHSYLSVDYPGAPKLPGVERAQLLTGSGVVLEPFNGNKSRTLVSYLIHTDLAGLPALITNRVLKRQPHSLHYLKEHLMKMNTVTQPHPHNQPATSTTDLASKSITSKDTIDPHLSFLESNPLYHDMYSPVVSEDDEEAEVRFPSLDKQRGFYPEELSNAPVVRPTCAPGWYSNESSSQEEEVNPRDSLGTVQRGSSSVLAKRKLIKSLEKSQSVLEFGTLNRTPSLTCGSSYDSEPDEACQRWCSPAGAQYCVETEGSLGSSPQSEGCEYTHVKKLLGLVKVEELQCNFKMLDDSSSHHERFAQQCELSTGGGEMSPKWSSLSSLVTGE